MSMINNIIPVSITLDVGKNEDKKVDDDKPKCQYGTECYQESPQHRKDYHDGKKPTSRKPKCEYGQKCYRKDRCGKQH